MHTYSFCSLLAALKYFDEHIATFGVSNCALPSMNQLQKLAAMLQLMTGLISYQLNCTTWHVGKAQLWHFLRDHLRTSGEGTSVNSLQPPQKLWEWPHPTQNYWSIRRTIAFRACIVIIWLSCTEEKAAMPDLQGTKTSVLIHLWWLVKNLVSGNTACHALCEACS